MTAKVQYNLGGNTMNNQDIYINLLNILSKEDIKSMNL